jgi:hypothetical protein
MARPQVRPFESGRDQREIFFVVLLWGAVRPGGMNRRSEEPPGLVLRPVRLWNFREPLLG